MKGRAAADSQCIARLRAAGAILVGKCTMQELGRRRPAMCRAPQQGGKPLRAPRAAPRGGLRDAACPIRTG